MGKVSEKKEKKRNDLFEAAFELFTKKGLLKTSIADIVEKAGVAKGTFYLYFSDKFDLANKLIYEKISGVFQNATERIDQNNVTNFDEGIIILVDNILDQMQEDREMLTFISRVLNWRVFTETITNEENIYGYNFIQEYNRHVIHSKKVYVKDPKIMMFLILEFINSSCCCPILYNDPLPLEEIKPYIHRTIKDIVHHHTIPYDSMAKFDD